jgi:hypothetical protein
MISSVMTFFFVLCNGAGYIFWGDNFDYDVEKCQCKNFAIGTLFTSGEAD